ncbi:hypothetical protein Ndes2526B_g01442 [Nannochloris sp. 'desiccata']|nr:hypothetical protein KSW81_004236 [Chlorella desiccata (nom. nud.)]KAH7624184.1 putative Protein EMBRYO DEFECTIVE 514 [Chlorella desiccata (nom. nud.)]
MTDASKEPQVAVEERAPDVTEEQPDAKRARVDGDATAATETATEPAAGGEAEAAPAAADGGTPEAAKAAPAVPRDPITVGYKTFTTGQECYKYFNHIICKYRKNQNLNDYEFHNVLELIRTGHPEAERKLSGTVSAIQIRDVYTAGMPSSCFHLLRENGDTEDVSYRKCVANLFDEMKEQLMSSNKNRVQSGGGGGRGGGGGGRRGGRGRGGSRGRGKN